jgi:hypothetical protein
MVDIKADKHLSNAIPIQMSLPDRTTKDINNSICEVNKVHAVANNEHDKEATNKGEIYTCHDLERYVENNDEVLSFYNDNYNTLLNEQSNEKDSKNASIHGESFSTFHFSSIRDDNPINYNNTRSNVEPPIEQFDGNSDSDENETEIRGKGAISYHEMQDSILGNSYSNFDYANIHNHASNSGFDFDFEDDDVTESEDNNGDDIKDSNINMNDSDYFLSLIESSVSNDDDNDEINLKFNGHDSLKRYERFVPLLADDDVNEVIRDNLVRRVSFDDASMKSSSTMSTNRCKRVQFSNVTVREYAITVGSHPTTCPMELAWEHTEEDIIIDIQRHKSSCTGLDDCSRNSCLLLRRLTKIPNRLSVSERRECIARVQGISICDVEQLEHEASAWILESMNSIEETTPIIC